MPPCTSTPARAFGYLCRLLVAEAVAFPANIAGKATKDTSAMKATKDTKATGIASRPGCDVLLASGREVS